MARLFDAYIIADWTAAEGKKLGDTSLWIGVAKRDVRFRLYSETHNVATRAEGEALLASLLAEHRKRGDRVLVGFDFNFGFPAGTAERLKLTGHAPWSAMWKFLASNVVDKPDNTNNRYQVAAKINRLMTDEAWPMWGAPANQAQRWLTTTKPPAGSGADIPEYRATQDAVRKGKLQPKSVWQMHGAGAVGGQTLVGVPAVRRLLEKLGPSGAVWPFGTGWRALDAADVEPLSALRGRGLAVDVRRQCRNEGEFKDQAQVRVTAEHFAALDEAGTLSAAFAPPKGADEALTARSRAGRRLDTGGLTGLGSVHARRYPQLRHSLRSAHGLCHQRTVHHIDGTRGQDRRVRTADGRGFRHYGRDRRRACAMRPRNLRRKHPGTGAEL